MTLGFGLSVGGRFGGPKNRTFVVEGIEKASLCFVLGGTVVFCLVIMFVV